MNKSPKERGPDLFVQAHRRSLRIFLNFLKILEVKRSIIKGGKEVGQLCANVEFSWETSLHDGDVEEFLRIKTPQWRR